ncbi:MAG TPA: YtxH domain-containing protein [Terriglobales bacterium]|jgi:gas vesicle protein|nr:YtxH domain-containing protein [Terriglobales bacterium]
MSDDSSNGFVWFLAGLGVGAALGVLYAPKAGRELREDIRSSAGSGRDYASERAQRVREQAGEWVDRGREVLNQQKEQFKSAFDAGRQAYRDVTSEG